MPESLAAGCSNCENPINVCASGLCTVCTLALSGMSITGMSRDETLAMMRKVRADARMRDVYAAMRDAVSDMTSGDRER